MKLQVKGNESGQILAGIDPWGAKEIDVDLTMLTQEERAELLSCSQPGSSSDSRRVWSYSVVQGTAEEVIARIRENLENQAKTEEHLRQGASVRAEEYLVTTVITRKRIHYGVEGTAYELPWCPDLTSKYLSEDLRERCSAHRKELGALVAEKNAAEESRMAPLIAEAKAAVEREEAEKEAKEKAALAAKYAKRLETGTVEIACTRGSRSEWGEPWIAKVSSRNGRRPEYDFSEGSYDLTTETLTIACKPGETIAWGQKNYRKPKRTIHEVRTMTKEGQLVS